MTRVFLMQSQVRVAPPLASSWKDEVLPMNVPSVASCLCFLQVPFVHLLTSYQMKLEPGLLPD